MVRSPKLVAVITVLSASVFAQMGGMGGFGGGGTPNSVSKATANAARGTGWNPWLSAYGNYSRPLSSSQQFVDSRPGSAGLSGGIGGSKQWGMKRFAGGYNGNVSYNPRSSQTAGKWRPSQSANLSYSQQVSQRLSFAVQQLGGMTYGGYGFASGLGINGVPGVTSPYGAGGIASGSTDFGDPAINGFVDNEIFSGRVKFYGTSGDVSYLVSQRLSISAFGDANFVRRTQGIRSANSYSGGAQTNYRLDARNGIGGGVTYFTSSYPGYFGNVRAMNYHGSFQHEFSPTTRFSGQAGVANMVSKFVGAIALPPELAAIIGTGASLQVTQSNFWTPTFTLSFRKSFEVGALSMGAGRAASMGNGVVMAGMRDMATIGFGRSLTSKIGANLSAGYSRASGRIGVRTLTETAMASGALSYRVAGGFSLSAQGGIRYVGVPGQSRRTDLFIGGSINWSPGSYAFFF